MRTLLRSLPALLVALTGAAALADNIEGTVQFPPGVDPRLSPAVVYVHSKQAHASSPGQLVEVDQRGLQFVPRVQAVAVGATIRFLNNDGEGHNVNSQGGCCPFNVMVAPGRHHDISPERPGVIRLLCNIHPHMRGYVVVCPSPLFALTDAAGQFRIDGVPDGTHRVVVWQEFSKQVARSVTVSGSKVVRFQLEPSGEFQSGRTVGSRTMSVPWTEVVQGIDLTLKSAIRAAGEPGGARQAERLALDAYFEHFEASGLETAILRFGGDQRTFDLHRMFARIRNPLLVDLAAGRIKSEPVAMATQELVSALEQEVAELHRRGVFDLSMVMSASGTNPSRPTDFDAVQVLGELRLAFRRVEQLAVAGEGAAAANALLDAYFEVFHRIEPALKLHNYLRARQIEQRFPQLVGRLESGIPGDEARRALASLAAEVERAAAALHPTQTGRLAAVASGFSGAFLILTREGVEALLIVTALLIYLKRVGQPSGCRAVYVGVIAAVVATLLTWGSLQLVLARSGAAQETIEGVASLVAGAVLFYVGYWLVSKSEALRWQSFLTGQLERGISRGSLLAFGTAGFLAVYREGAETMLMFQPILLQSDGGKLAGVAGGTAAAVLALLAFFWALRFGSVRLAIRPFFRITGVLLFLLAVVFAGKGVSELQEAGILLYTPLPNRIGAAVGSLPAWLRDVLGLGSSVQSLAMQGTLLGGAVTSLVAVRLLDRGHPPHSAGAPPTPGSATSVHAAVGGSRN